MRQRGRRAGSSRRLKTGQEVPANWYPDPARYGWHRYWDGAQWTRTVSDGYEVGTDETAEPAQYAPPRIGSAYLRISAHAEHHRRAHRLRAVLRRVIGSD
jgi:uncharacterized protein DUF2510